MLQLLLDASMDVLCLEDHVSTVKKGADSVVMTKPLRKQLVHNVQRSIYYSLEEHARNVLIQTVKNAQEQISVRPVSKAT